MLILKNFVEKVIFENNTILYSLQKKLERITILNLNT